LKHFFIAIFSTIFLILSNLSASEIKPKNNRFVSIFINHTLFINIRKLERKEDNLIINFGNNNRIWTIPYSEFATDDKVLFFSLSPAEISDILKKLKEKKNVVIDFDALTKNYY